MRSWQANQAVEQGGDDIMAKRHISLKLAFVAAFFIVTAIPVWLAWEWPQQAALQIEEDAVNERHAVYMKPVTVALQRYHTDIVGTFQFFANDLENDKNSVTAENGARLLGPLGFNHVCRFNIVTRALAGSAYLPGKECPASAPPAKLRMFTDLAVEGQVRFSQVSKHPDGYPMMFAMQRFGEYVTIGALKTDYFHELGETIKFGERGHVAIVDHTGRALWHPLKEWRDTQYDMSGMDIVQRMIAGETGNMRFHSDAMDAEMVAAFTSVKGPGWGVMVPQPTQEMKNYVSKVRSMTLQVLLVALAIAALLALLAAHLLVEPLQRIRKSAERLGNGFGDALIPPHGAGARLTEINDLRATFNAMVLRVRNAQRTEIEARKEAQEANRIKSRFLANMSHELRTPLNAIIGFAEVTEKRLPGKEHDRNREYLGYIHDSGKHLLTIINDLLDLSRIEAGVHKLDETEVDVADCVHEIIHMLTPMADEKGITLIMRKPGDKMYLWADQRALKQIALNLATNAVRYTQNGGKVEIGTKRSSTGSIEFFVKDNGPGIKFDEMDNIRKPFVRAKAHEVSAVPGTGLGLSIVDALAELHDARFDLNNNKDAGTLAQVIFPPSRALLTLGKPRERLRQPSGRRQERDEAG